MMYPANEFVYGGMGVICSISTLAITGIQAAAVTAQMYQRHTKAGTNGIAFLQAVGYDVSSQ